jgi:hypothetical protein
MACNSECNKCNQCADWCTCDVKKVVGECESETSSNCIIYKPNGGLSGIDKFIGFPTGKKLELILERLDLSLYNLNSVQASDCAKTLLNLSTVSDLSTVIYKVLDFLCTVDDTKVKINSSDASSGYLFDKIDVGECINKVIVTAENGDKVVKFELDYDCVTGKVNDVSWADVSPSETVCTGNDLYKKQISNNDNFRWVLSGANHSSCVSCTPAWVDISPVERKCVSTGAYSLQLSKKQEDGCGNVRWVDDSVFTWDSSSIDCSGASTVATLQVTPNIPTEFAIDNGTGTYQWVNNGTNSYDISGLPKTGGLKNFKARPIGLTCTIGGILEMCTGLTSCEELTWTNTDTTRCNSDVSEIQQVSNCGTTRWVAGGDACNSCTDPIPLISISADDSTICGSQIATVTASHNGCTTITWFKRVSGGADVQLGTGNSITTASNASIYATCENCNGTVNSVSDVNITYSVLCAETCGEPVLSLTKTCNTNPNDVNVWKTNVNMTNINSGNRYAVYPNTDGTGVVPNYANATPITGTSVLLKSGVGVGEIVKVKVYNGSDNCFSNSLATVVSSDCLDSCVEVSSVIVTTINTTPKVGDTVIYTATPNGSAPFTFVWKIDGVVVNNETSANFTKTWAAGDVGTKAINADITNCLGNGTSTGIANVPVVANINTIVAASNC